ncbi:MAG TPA: PadR family transcriptional regulator [Mycobacterium sp.]|nr:PadR family transcriptional regulator [Mycobacterium sp.]
MSLRHAVLGLLHPTALSGYELHKIMQSDLASVWPATQSQIYAVLAQLAAGNLITVADVGPRRRQRYCITAGGTAELHRWLTSTTIATMRRSPLLLRLLLLDQVTPPEARRSLVSWARATETDRASLSRSSCGGVEPDHFAHAVRDYLARLAVVESDWARWVLDRVDRRANSDEPIAVTPRSTAASVRAKHRQGSPSTEPRCMDSLAGPTNTIVREAK